MNKLLKITNLKKIYHTKNKEIEAISDFSLTLNENEFIALVGPSGCGKSTILKILSGIEEKSDGKVEIKENTKLGYMLQEDSLFDWLTIKENCLLGLEITKRLNENYETSVLNELYARGLDLSGYDAEYRAGIGNAIAADVVEYENSLIESVTGDNKLSEDQVYSLLSE